jgi:hypothetical protein
LVTRYLLQKPGASALVPKVTSGRSSERRCSSADGFMKGSLRVTCKNKFVCVCLCACVRVCVIVFVCALASLPHASARDGNVGHHGPSCHLQLLEPTQTTMECRSVRRGGAQHVEPCFDTFEVATEMSHDGEHGSKRRSERRMRRRGAAGSGTLIDQMHGWKTIEDRAAEE